MSLAVVKVGGSFARDRRLGGIAASLAQAPGRVVVVPGGGPFADTVRREQARIGYSDHAAHRMALFAMAQFGTLLASLAPGLVPATGPEGMRRALADGHVPVWLPLNLLAGDPAVPENWHATSDSLAALLATRLGAARLIFVKRVQPRAVSLSELAAAGVLDPLVPRFLEDDAVEAWICGPRHLARLRPALAEGKGIGRRIEVA